MRLYTIDNLFSAPSNPLNILDVAVLQNAPFLSLCCCMLVYSVSYDLPAWCSNCGIETV